jgi:RND family efflux transporter MFP subunit
MSDQLSSDLASLRIAREETPPRRGWLRGVLALVVVGGALGAAYVVGMPYLESKVFKLEVSVTEVSRVSPAQASVALTSSGYVVALKESSVAVKVPGKVAKRYVSQGSKVKAGDLLLEIDPSDQKAAIAAAQSRVASTAAQAQRARAELAALQVQAKRERALVEAGVSPKGNVEDLEAREASFGEAVKASDADIRAAQAEVQAMRVNLGNYTLNAPIDGTVLNKPPEVGEYVGPQPAGIAVDMGGVQIADFTSLVAEIDVPEGRLHLVKMGGPAEIQLDAYPDRRYRGKTLEVTPTVDRSKATVTVRVTFVDPADGALPNMAARVSFLEKEVDEAAIKSPPKTIVPGAAIADRNGAKVVFVLDGGVAHMRTLELGAPFGDGFEVVKGLAPGTQLVKNPPATLTDGQRVQEKNES